jgi:putative FmdB family regulatory protein
MKYIYFCKKCNFEKEVNHLMKEDPEIICDECKSIMRRKVTGGCGFLIKGNVTRRDTYLGNKIEQFKDHPETDPYRKWRE